MNTTTYKKDSWHYRINTSHNMLIPHIAQLYGYATDNDGHESYQKIAPRDSCSYWSNVLFYLFLQVPLLFFIGFVGTLAFIYNPLFSLTMTLLYGYTPDLLMGLVFLGCYTLLAIMFYVLLKIEENPPEWTNDIKEMYSSLKDKYCKKLEFK